MSLTSPSAALMVLREPVAWGEWHMVMEPEIRAQAEAATRRELIAAALSTSIATRCGKTLDLSTFGASEIRTTIPPAGAIVCEWCSDTADHERHAAARASA